MFNVHLCETEGFWLTKIASGYEILTENDKNSTGELSHQRGKDQNKRVTHP